ncbi:MAG: RNA 2',3'-cyclic phosphodiesterase [Chloroflexi bacterium]|nr:RNA 2',3'-cyclic phosphodiesterase [Chloroflexota bacterium]
MADHDRPNQLRLFVACALSADVRDGLRRIQDDLRRLGADRLRWTRPEGIHVTLKFLGDVDEARVEEISSALADAIEPFELRLQPAALGGFGGARLRVVWVGLQGDVDALSALAGRVDAALTPLGFPKERRPFAAHLTLARVPDQVPPAERRKLAALIDGYRSPPLPSMIVTDVSLMQSTLGPRGSVYQRLASFPREG